MNRAGGRSAWHRRVARGGVSEIRYVLFDSYGLYLQRLLTRIALSKLGVDGGVAQW
jgi:hypothetical protein